MIGNYALLLHSKIVKAAARSLLQTGQTNTHTHTHTKIDFNNKDRAAALTILECNKRA